MERYDELEDKMIYANKREVQTVASFYFFEKYFAVYICKHLQCFLPSGFKLCVGLAKFNSNASTQEVVLFQAHGEEEGVKEAPRGDG